MVTFPADVRPLWSSPFCRFFFFVSFVFFVVKIAFLRIPFCGGSSFAVYSTSVGRVPVPFFCALKPKREALEPGRTARDSGSGTRISMTELYIVRHGIAVEHGAPGIPDDDGR